ncbi:MAG: hypothetical protein DHS20C11_10850 [Lysobacteraceae bacterium]|nr:MAG: hypothetical protein DHS20C11_10850 [Xanthomonadaceae bacterium]
MMGVIMQQRATDTETRCYFRTERITFENGQWYCSVRDDAPAGPFASKEDAEAALLLMLRDLQTEDQHIA